MTKDRRYNTVKNLIMGGYVKTLNEIFDTVPKTVVAKDMGTNLARLNKMIGDPQIYSFRDMVKLASLIEVDELAIMTLIYAQYQALKKSKRKK
jgi:hypothetical protein